MKQGSTLPEALATIQEIERTKIDLVAPKSKIQYVLHPEAGVRLSVGEREFAVRPRAHRQLGEELGIPAAYYNRLASEAPDLLVAEGNRWLSKKPAERRLIRAVQGDVRAVLSDRYRPLDNFDLAEAILPVVTAPGIRVESCAITEDRFYLKVVNERQTAEVRVGDVVQAGLVIGNSEVGMGSVFIDPLVWRLSCKNGAIREDARMRKYHVGRRTGGDEDVAAVRFYSDETRKLDDRAFWSKVSDTVRGAFDEAFFKAGVDEMKRACGIEVAGGDLDDAIEVLTERASLNESERGRILENFINGKDLTRYGLVNAVTLAAQDDVLTYERATELERLGGAILAGKI